MVVINCGDKNHSIVTSLKAANDTLTLDKTTNYIMEEIFKTRHLCQMLVLVSCLLLSSSFIVTVEPEGAQFCNLYVYNFSIQK